ncbi:extracellular solute-binding protein [Microbacterium thalassium]|uniref:Multiple sugar transport system substrate-binding protein n=1 Tax=Microbacterium thalassium TaxID=362649 RepID=A0A7X0KTY6_9MICO|nr:extracellular solute-binding protein [Microbacterium thalassium]MBB6390574.1 multiple sugar transport system substrate-binding protein [Microbacterium thalassium]GLK25685.1 sugar ABC transporter substrate-binding protein [Microbacterium thalassium]
MSEISKRSHRLLIGTGVALTGAMVALTGCSASGGASADGPTEVTVMYKSSEFTEDMIAAFEEENPDITISFIEYDQTRLNAMLASGDAPDLVRGGPNANLFAKGLATNLDDFLASSDVLNADLLLPANDAWRWDGSQVGTGSYYGIIKDWSPDATIWQNEALFEEAGVEPLDTVEVTSWDDVLEKAIELKDAGIEYPFGIEWQWGLGNLFLTMVAQQGGTVYTDGGAAVDLETPEAQRAISWLVDYGKAEVGPTSLNPLPDGQDAPTFVAGKMAMSMDGYWFGGNLQDEAAATVAETASMAPAPTFGERISPIFGGVGAWIPEASKHKDAAWTVMEYFMAGQPAADRATTGWGLPILESLWSELPTEEPYQQQAADAALIEAEYVVPLEQSQYAQGSQWDQVIDEQVTSAIKGEQSAEEAATAIQDQMNVYLAQSKDQLG